MPAKFLPVTVEPSAGGKLITRASSEVAGVLNYTSKRDWRRDLDQEMRREGIDYFWPRTDGDFTSTPGGQPFPNDVTAITPTSIARSVATATVTFATAHTFSEGETVKISGANESQYNGSVVIRNVTRTTFDYTVLGGPASPATGSLSVKSDMPINLVTLARRPNGQTAIIVGTKTRLFRFYALENGAYVSEDPNDYPAGETPLYWSESAADYPPGEIPEYVEDNSAEWIVIGSGFSINGRRWEAVHINGYAVFTNGVDLPMTYRVEDIAVKPIYELREQGVATFATEAELTGILLGADVSEIFEDKLVELFDPSGIKRGGDVLANQTANTVTVNAPFFVNDTSDSDIGRYIVYEDGTPAKITAYTSPVQVTVDVSQTITNQKFKLRVKGSQTGNQFSGSINGSQPSGSTTVTASSAFFDAGMVNKDLRYTNGWSARITAFTDATHVTVSRAAPAAEPGFTGFNEPFYISDGATSATPYADYIVVSTAPLFTTEMIGRNIVWDNGTVRRIDAVQNESPVGSGLYLEARVDVDMAIASDWFGVEDPDTYGTYTETEFINRIQYKIIWSAVNEPRRWASIVPGSMQAGSNIVTLDYAAKSFESGQEILVVGAGVNGGNLTANVLYVAGSRVLALDQTAVTSVTDASVQQSDVVGSISGAFELQDDSSGIIRMMELQGTLVIYKDTSFFLGSYTGDVDQPFVFKMRKVPNSKTLYYRYTLISVNGLAHVYCGRNAIYRLDLTNQLPQELELGELCKDVFFSRASLEQTDDIFAADNALTQEAFLVFPSDDDDKILAFDYLQNTFSTSSIDITAAATVKRPETGISIGETENWFVMANAQGTVLLYGKTEEDVVTWGNTKEITYRRFANPFSATKVAYDSFMRGGMSDFGDSYDEKDINEYVLLLSSHSLNATILIQFLGTRNTAEAATVLGSYTLVSPKTKNMIPVYFRQNYFQDSLTVSGYDNPVRLAKRIWSVSGLKSSSFIRRP